MFYVRQILLHAQSSEQEYKRMRYERKRLISVLFTTNAIDLGMMTQYNVLMYVYKCYN